MRVVQWLPIAGAIAVARRSPPLALMLSLWFWPFVILKGSILASTVDSGSFFRFVLPAIPAFVLLAASVPLLIPKYGIAFARRTALPPARPIGRRWAIAAVVTLGLVPVGAVAAINPTDDPNRVLQEGGIAAPVGAIELRATSRGDLIALDWDTPRASGANVFYRLYRSPSASDHSCFEPDSRCRFLRAREPGAAYDPTQRRGRPPRARHVDVQGRRRGELGRRPPDGRRLPPLEPRHRHGSVTRRPWLGEALALAGLLAVAAFVYIRGVEAAANYDEGVYLASLDALRHGQELGTDVYASQPPGFYVLLQGLSLLPGDGVEGIRVAFVLVALLGPGRRLRHRQEAGRRLGSVRRRRAACDHRALAGAGAARPGGHGVDCARALRGRGRVLRRPLLVAVGGRGRACGRRDRGQAARLPCRGAAGRAARRPPLVAGGRRVCSRERLAVWAVLLVVYAGALGELWESVVADHRDARGLGPSVADNVERVLLHPLDWRTPAGVLVPIGLVAAVVLLRRRRAARARRLDRRVGGVPRRAAAAARPPLRPARRHPGGARRRRARRGCRARSRPGALRRRRRRGACDRSRLRPGGAPALAPGRRSAWRHLGRRRSYAGGRSRTSSSAPICRSLRTSPTGACRGS